ncbi:hypothetical protein EMPG_14242 [Blastomyces silverae]|uniref:Uncharacterized protein n=1 Tax=Blastomyces silverae TaxID=2060906 RepID=A0A0H1BML8_9EURO|nr:hypothetical protein EMPG_14242 [Blastomyces silverae]
MGRRQRPRDRELRQGSESSSTGSWRSHDTARQGSQSHDQGQDPADVRPTPVRSSGQEPRLLNSIWITTDCQIPIILKE